MQGTVGERWSTVIAVALMFSLCSGCLTEDSMLADGVDITFADIAPDAGAMRANPAVAPVRPKPVQTTVFDDRAHVAGSSMAHPTGADPDAAKRQFFLAWVRVTMPTTGPGQPGAVSAVFTPQPGSDDEYWKVTSGAVLCDSGKPSVRGTNLKDIDCGSKVAP